MPRTVPRTRRYVARHTLVAVRPFVRFSHWRDAYVLRVVGNRVGPVLREERRHQSLTPVGVERRRVATR